jgi:Mycolic acid cyclopropane synthetase
MPDLAGGPVWRATGAGHVAEVIQLQLPKFHRTSAQMSYLNCTTILSICWHLGHSEVRRSCPGFSVYSLFLDRDRQYSCAYFPKGSETLEEAQEA